MVYRCSSVIEDTEGADFRGEPIRIGRRVLRRNAEENEETTIDGANAFASDIDVRCRDALNVGAHGNEMRKVYL
jgi:hypothetical protein